MGKGLFDYLEEHAAEAIPAEELQAETHGAIIAEDREDVKIRNSKQKELRESLQRLIWRQGADPYIILYRALDLLAVLYSAPEWREELPDAQQWAQGLKNAIKGTDAETAQQVLFVDGIDAEREQQQLRTAKELEKTRKALTREANRLDKLADEMRAIMGRL